MNPLTVGKNYLLRLPGGQVLGEVRIQRFEDDWAEGPFRPTDAFAEVRELFVEESQLRNDRIIPLWEQAAGRIETLGIQVVAEDGQLQPDLRVLLDGNEAFLALPLQTA